MQQGRDPTRRNRNIGTARQGHGQDNRNVIPRTWSDSRYAWKRVPGHSVVSRYICGRHFHFVVEHTREDSFHACTVNDIATMLRAFPEDHVKDHEHINGIRGVVLRQPTRKEDSLNPVWGRIGFGVNVGPLTGPVIILAAQSIPLTIKWGRHLRAEDRDELDRLMNFADDVQTDRRHYTMRFDLEGVRRVQLYHTLPHEIGHWADMLRHVELPSSNEDDDTWEALWEKYWQRPLVERESYAHGYAVELIEHLRTEGRVPFDREMHVEALEEEGLRPEDFLPS